MVIFMGGQSNMPIHDHHGMVVFSKCLRGSYGVDLWDYENCESVYQSIDNKDYKNMINNGVPVVYNESFDMKEGEVSIVRPYKNNIHSFRPKEASVIFDLIVNDYDFERPYKEFVK